MIDGSTLPHLIRAELPAIIAACQRFGVARLEVFGSVLTPDFHKGSDVDFVVLFREDARAKAFDNFFGLKEALEALLKRRVELVSLRAISNPLFRKEIERTAEPVYVQSA